VEQALCANRVLMPRPLPSVGQALCENRFLMPRPSLSLIQRWFNSRPNIGGFWDEDSAYWIDGMTRLGLVLHDQTLLARVKQDFDFVLDHPYNFHNVWHSDTVEGWVRSIYARGMLAYYGGTGDDRVQRFFANAYSNYSAADSRHVHQDQSHQGSRSMTQMEVLLESHSYGGPSWMVDKALSLMGFVLCFYFRCLFVFPAVLCWDSPTWA
jgi:hypothetical protein